MMQTKLRNSISERIFKLKKSNDGKKILAKKKIGFMVAGVDPKTQNLGIGFSLCCNRDKFDHVPQSPDIKDHSTVKVKGYGRMFAAERAVEWIESKDYINVPPSIEPDVVNFIKRCRKYYQDKDIPQWAEQYIK